jgi:DNA-binding NarL/FixJ family response regulator
MRRRVLLYEQQELIRSGVRMALDAEPDIAVIMQPTTEAEAASLIRRTSPDVVVTQFSATVLDASRRLGLAAGTRCARPGIPVVVVLSSDPTGPDLDEALSAGARGVVLRSESSRRVVDAVRAVADGGAFLASSVAGYVLERLIDRWPNVDAGVLRRVKSLTERETEVLRLIAAGMTTVQVACVLQLSRATVKSHVSHILGKLGLVERAQAVGLAYQVGMVTSSDFARLTG